MPLADRKYDIVLYGASGFTGKQTAEYCRRFAPSGLRWAIAGRNRSKLDTVNSAARRSLRASRLASMPGLWIPGSARVNPWHGGRREAERRVVLSRDLLSRRVRPY